MLHATCGAFLYLVDGLKAKIPATDFASCEEDLWKNFKNGLYDAEVQHVIESMVPPVNLTSVSFLRSCYCNICG